MACGEWFAILDILDDGQHIGIHWKSVPINRIEFQTGDQEANAIAF